MWRVAMTASDPLLVSCEIRCEALHSVRPRGPLHALARLFDERPHDRAKVACLAIHRHLPLRARAVVQDLMHVAHFPPASQVVHHIVHEREQLESELAHRDFLPIPEVDQLAFEPPARRAPFVLFDQRPMVAAEPEIALAKRYSLR